MPLILKMGVNIIVGEYIYSEILGEFCYLCLCLAA